MNQESRPRAPRPAAEIDHAFDPCRRVKSLDDVLRDQEMEGGIEEGKGGALARAVEGAAAGKLLAALNVAGRERPERAGDFRLREVREMPLVQRGEPALERVLSVQRSAPSVAERKGFEPLEAFRLQRFSRPPP